MFESIKSILKIVDSIVSLIKIKLPILCFYFGHCKK